MSLRRYRARTGERKARRKRTSSSSRQDRSRVLLVATRHVISASRRTNSSIEGEYARVGSPVHRTVFRRELSPRGKDNWRNRERQRESACIAEGRTNEKERQTSRLRRNREGMIALRRVASKQPLSENSRWWRSEQNLEGVERSPTAKPNTRR